MLTLIQILRRHHWPVTGQALAGEVNVSLRTLYRDIGDLIGQGVPITGEAGLGYVLDQGYDLPPLMFKADELEAIMLGVRWVSRQGDSALTRAAQDVIAKIGTVLPQNLQSYLLDAPLIVPQFAENLTDKLNMGELRQTMREERKLKIHYQDNKPQVTERVIWPFAIAYFEQKRIILSWCELRADFRSFRTDRIIQAEALTAKYPERRLKLFNRWKKIVMASNAASSFDVFL